jgi:hypothetical protein
MFLLLKLLSSIVIPAKVGIHWLHTGPYPPAGKTMGPNVKAIVINRDLTGIEKPPGILAEQ